ncbi:hypothetical protein Avbf_10109 [Armadillidium vulgare]|nr:hypothetical protein Avbf_10109 [Armadillidium vulgare]
METNDLSPQPNSVDSREQESSRKSMNNGTERKVRKQTSVFVNQDSLFNDKKNFVDDSYLESRGGRLNVKSVSRKGDEVSRNERKKNRKNGLKNQSLSFNWLSFRIT